MYEYICRFMFLISIIVILNMGANKKENVNMCFKCSLIMIAVFGFISQVFLIYAAKPLSSFIMSAGDGEMLNNAVEYLRFVAWFYVICYADGAFPGWYIGINNVTLSFVGVVMQIAVRTVLSWLLVGTMGLKAVSAGTAVGWICMFIYFAVYMIVLKKHGFYKMLSRDKNNKAV